MVLLWLAAAQADETISDSFRSEISFEPPPSFRVALDQRVELPAALWFTSDFNRQVRVLRYRLGLVLDCETTRVVEGFELDCKAKDAAIAADAFEDGIVQPILDEIDQKLTDSRVTVVLTDSGRVRDVDLDEAGVNPQINRRINQMHENLRLMVRKAVLGLEMPLEHEPGATLWPTRRTDLAQGVSSSGTVSHVRLVHELHPAPDDLLIVRSSGRGVSAPSLGETLLTYDVQIESIAVYDPARSMLTERLWTVTSLPTASNPLADGFEGLRGRVESSMRVVRKTEAVELFPSIERTPVVGGAL